MYVLPLFGSLFLYFRFQCPRLSIGRLARFPFCFATASLVFSLFPLCEAFQCFTFCPLFSLLDAPAFSLFHWFVPLTPFPPPGPSRGSVSFAILPFVSSLCHYHSRPHPPLVGLSVANFLLAGADSSVSPVRKIRTMDALIVATAAGSELGRKIGAIAGSYEYRRG